MTIVCIIGAIMIAGLLFILFKAGLGLVKLLLKISVAACCGIWSVDFIDSHVYSMRDYSLYIGVLVMVTVLLIFWFIKTKIKNTIRKI